MKTPKPTTIESYISTAPKTTQPHLREMLAILRKAVPDATESIKWSMPAFSYKRILFMFGAFKSHIGFYPTPSAMKSFTKDLSKYVHAKGSIQFPYDKPLPKTLITKIAKFRAKESKTEDKRWM
jgi:uncharacterized protein YdhG (YjbR/CyaY superfamily)